MRIFTSTLAILLSSMLGATALAGLPPEEIARLDGDLTPMGAIRAGNADGLIPEWTGKIRGLPPGLQWGGPGTPYPDPWPDEKPLFVITKDNMDEHRERLTPGMIAMFETYPDTFRMPVYPGHRDFAFYQNYYDKVRYNAEHAQLTEDNEGITGFVGAVAFPIPANGPQAVWLARTNDPFETTEGEYSDIAVFPNNTRSGRRTRFIQEAPYANRNNTPSPEVEYPKLGHFAGYIMTNVTDPPRDKGTITVVIEPFDYVTNAREVWRYLPGARRVRRAPTVGFDTPDGPGGLKTVDETQGFNGSMERFDWALIGRLEYYIPYHNYKFDDPSVSYTELLTRFHVNPDYMRYELKRVWVVEATLREGQRHIYGKRRLYIDEDTGIASITENFDGRNELWKVVLNNNIYEYNGVAYIRRAQMYHDLRAGAYIAERLINDTAPMLFDIAPVRGPAYFTPDNIRMLGRR